MNTKTHLRNAFGIAIVAGIVAVMLPASTAQAQACNPAAAPAGGTLDPCTVPKYVLPLVIPPVMNDAGGTDTTSNYDIAVRQFQQQILPGGIWNTVNGRADNFPATTVWSYGPAADSADIVAPDPDSQFNYPAYTIENTAYTTTTVDWINDLVDGSGNYLPHLLPIDQTLHWANPGADCAMGSARTDCRGASDRALHRPGADRDPRSRRARRPGERRLPRGVVAAEREQHHLWDGGRSCSESR